MNSRWVRTALLCVCLAGAGALCASAQRGPGGMGGPGGGMGGGPSRGPGGPGGFGGPGDPPPPRPNGVPPNNDSRGGLQSGPIGRWWDDKKVVGAIGLRKDQQKKMDTVFDAHKPAILDSYKSLLAEQAKLDTLMKQPNADKAQVFAAIDSVNQARAALQKANTEMLLDIRSELEPEQIEKLQAVR
jgi:Spy/CpxP family protein refolding chaperone